MWHFEVKEQDTIIEHHDILRTKLQISLQKSDENIEGLCQTINEYENELCDLKAQIKHQEFVISKFEN